MVKSVSVFPNASTSTASSEGDEEAEGRLLSHLSPEGRKAFLSVVKDVQEAALRSEGIQRAELALDRSVMNHFFPRETMAKINRSVCQRLSAGEYIDEDLAEIVAPVMPILRPEEHDRLDKTIAKAIQTYTRILGNGYTSLSDLASAYRALDARVHKDYQQQKTAFEKLAEVLVAKHFGHDVCAIGQIMLSKWNSKEAHSEIDVRLTYANVEVTLAKNDSNKINQVKKLLTDSKANPHGRPLILVAPLLSEKVTRKLHEIGKENIHVVRGDQELKNITLLYRRAYSITLRENRTFGRWRLSKEADLSNILEIIANDELNLMSKKLRGFVMGSASDLLLNDPRAAGVSKEIAELILPSKGDRMIFEKTDPKYLASIGMPAEVIDVIVSSEALRQTLHKRGKFRSAGAFGLSTG